MEKDTSNFYRTVFSKQHLFTLIKYSPGFFIVLYAYLYFIGYVYLSTYFNHWKLNVIDMGFSIIDYATVSIYPIYMIGTTAILAISIAGLAKRSFHLKAKGKWSFIKKALLLMAPMILVVLSWPLFDRSHVFFVYFLMAVSGTILYYVVLLGKQIYPALLILLVVSPFISGACGSYQASLFLSYSFNSFPTPYKIAEIVLYTYEGMGKFDLHEKGQNEYGDLLLLAEKNETYYLIPDLEKSPEYIKKLEAKTALLKEKKNELDNLSKEEEKFMNSLNTKEVEDNLKKIELLIEQAKKSSIDHQEKTLIMTKLKELSSRNNMLQSRNIHLLEEANKSNSKSKVLLGELKKLEEEHEYLFNLFENISHVAYAINKERVKKVDYIRKGDW